MPGNLRTRHIKKPKRKVDDRRNSQPLEGNTDDKQESSSKRGAVDVIRSGESENGSELTVCSENRDENISQRTPACAKRTPTFYADTNTQSRYIEKDVARSARPKRESVFNSCMAPTFAFPRTLLKISVRPHPFVRYAGCGRLRFSPVDVRTSRGRRSTTILFHFDGRWPSALV